MFCPRCATQNELEQNYCRQCGQLLSGARLDLERSWPGQLENAKRGEALIRNGTIILVVFTLIALIVAITTVIISGLTSPTILSVIIDLLLGLAIGLPLIVVGRVKLKRERGHLPEASHQFVPSLPDPVQQVELSTNLKADLHPPGDRDSVTDRTTLDLQNSERGSRRS